MTELNRVLSWCFEFAYFRGFLRAHYLSVYRLAIEAPTWFLKCLLWEFEHSKVDEWWINLSIFRFGYHLLRNSSDRLDWKIFGWEELRIFSHTVMIWLLLRRLRNLKRLLLLDALLDWLNHTQAIFGWGWSKLRVWIQPLSLDTWNFLKGNLLHLR